MKLIKFLSLTIALFAFASCSKTKSTEETKVVKTVTLDIASVATKSVDGPIANNTPTAIKDGALFFFDVNGVRVYTHILGANPVGQIIITNVPSSATQIMMIANYTASTGSNYGDFAEMTLTQTREVSLDISGLQSNGNGIENVIMTSTATQIAEADDSTVEAPKGKANIIVTPIISRIEIKSIGTKTTTDKQISDFRVLGVFIPNHYAQGNLASVGKNPLIKPELSNYNAKFPYAASDPRAGYLNDYNANGMSLAEGKAYAYHTFPANGVENLPMIVVKVDQVKYNDGINPNALFDNGNVQYITVKSYKDKNGVNQITKFDAAKIYSISALNFSVDNLTNDPYIQPKQVEVNVAVTAWEIIEITPDL